MEMLEARYREDCPNEEVLRQRLVRDWRWGEMASMKVAIVYLGAQEAALVPEGFLRWLNDVRPAGQPELSDMPFSVEGVVEAL
jgi:hypothetical protein